MYLLKKCLFFFITSLIIFNLSIQEARADIINDFTKALLKKCGATVSSKRLLLSIMKSKNNEENPCDNTIVINIMSKCEEKSFTCQDATKLYETVRLSQGTILGN